MSITRAFTLRSKSQKSAMAPTIPLRAGSMRHSDKPVDIRTISGPLALVSTTNTNLPNVPDVSTIRAQRKASNSVSSGSSISDAGDSDTSDTSHLSELTDITTPSSPPSRNNSLLSSFKRSPRRSASSVELRHQSTSSAGSSPEIPSRAPSHSKKAHERLSRMKSLQQVSNHSSSNFSNMSSISEISSQEPERRSSFDFFTADLDKAPAPIQIHPFGKELEQLDEIVEEYGGVVRDAERDNDIAVMSKKGCVRLCAEDYIREIQPLFSRIFETPEPVAWI